MHKYMEESIYLLEHYHVCLLVLDNFIHPEGTCSSAACHVTGVPANVLTLLLLTS
jgi:hypothetical protein